MAGLPHVGDPLVYMLRKAAKGRAHLEQQDVAIGDTADTASFVFFAEPAEHRSRAFTGIPVDPSALFMAVHTYFTQEHFAQAAASFRTTVERFPFAAVNRWDVAVQAPQYHFFDDTEEELVKYFVRFRRHNDLVVVAGGYDEDFPISMDENNQSFGYQQHSIAELLAMPDPPHGLSLKRLIPSALGPMLFLEDNKPAIRKGMRAEPVMRELFQAFLAQRDLIYNPPTDTDFGE